MSQFSYIGNETSKEVPLPPAKFDVPSAVNETNWQIKIYDNEPSFEVPHVTIIQKSGLKSWRVNLRDLQNGTWTVIDTNPPARDIPKSIKKHLEKEKVMNKIISEWNKMFPNNSVEVKL